MRRNQVGPGFSTAVLSWSPPLHKSIEFHSTFKINVADQDDRVLFRCRRSWPLRKFSPGYIDIFLIDEVVAQVFVLHGFWISDKHLKVISLGL